MDEENLEVLQRRTLKKLDRYIIPCLSFLWLANFIDRANIANARIAGLEADLNLKGNDFNIGLAVFFISYIIVEIPANLLLRKVKANRWLPLFTVAWGLTTFGTGFVKNFSGLVAARFFLGFCEGSLFPCMILYMSTLYPRHKLQFRMGSFYSAVAFAGAFGGLLAAAILKMDGVGGIAGWRWIFIIEGLATIVIGLIVLWIIPADLESAKFLTDEERNGYMEYYVRRNPHAFAFSVKRSEEAMVEALPESNSTDTKSSEEKADEVQLEAINGQKTLSRTLGSNQQEQETFEWFEVKRGLLDPQSWITGMAFFSNITAIYAFTLFLPSILVQLGYRGVDAQIHSVYPFIPAASLTAFVSYCSDKKRVRGPFVLGFMPIGMAGFIILLVTNSNTVRYAAFFLVAIGVFPCSPGIVSTLANNHSGYYKRAASLGLQIALGNCGGILSTFVYTSDQQPRYIKGHSIVLALVVFSWFLVAINMTYCWLENKARAEGRRQGNIKKYRKLVEVGKTKAPIGDRDPGFRFTL